VTDRSTFRPYRTGVAFVQACHDLAPADFEWRTNAYEFVDRIPAIDLLTGSAAVRSGVEGGATLESLVASWVPQEQDFADRRRQFLLYP